MSDAPIDLLKAMAHPSRFAILTALSDGERNVGDIERLSGIPQPALSQQLAVLRDSGLVESRRDAKLVFYTLCPGALARVRDALDPLFRTAEAGTRRSVHHSAEGVAVFARMR